MSQSAEVRVTSAPLPQPARPWFLLRVCTNNPFYVLSAALFLAGLWVSFGEQLRAEDTWALMAGLAGYTLLLAVTGCLLVRFGNVWDDVRTVLLLAVLMFLATSVTFDEVLVLHPVRGFRCCLAGLLLAVAVSEGLLRGMRLRLPALFRGPYYLILAVFFLYPLALSQLAARPHSEALLWGLFGFSPAAGLVFLTLLPAIRRGPDYVRDNGSPWRWPLYPWVLFGMLAAAVPARSFLLCWSMHLLDAGDRNRLIFGPYFLVPVGLALAILILEIGIVSREREVLHAALLAPLVLALLAVIGHRPDAVYQGFLRLFTERLGGSPLSVTLLASAGFYTYAALRGVSGAAGALTAALVALAVVGPNTVTAGELAGLRPGPLLAATALQLGLGVWRRSSGSCLLGALGLAAVVALALPEPWRAAVGFHLALVAVLAVGTIFDDALGVALRIIGAALVLLACLATTVHWFDSPAGVPPAARLVYPLIMAALLAGYGLVFGQRAPLVVTGLIVAAWLVGASLESYRALRQAVSGLNYLVLSLLLFAVAVLVSLGKSGILARWLGVERGWHKVGEASGAPPPEGIWREGEGTPVPAAVQQMSVAAPEPADGRQGPDGTRA
jgi:hypothetical protein